MRTQNIYELFVGGRNFTIDRGRFSPGFHGLQIFVIVPESNGLGPSPSIGFGFIIRGIIIVLVIIINLCNVEHRLLGEESVIVYMVLPILYKNLNQCLK